MWSNVNAVGEAGGRSVKLCERALHYSWNLPINVILSENKTSIDFG